MALVHRMTWTGVQYTVQAQHPALRNWKHKQIIESQAQCECKAGGDLGNGLFGAHESERSAELKARLHNFRVERPAQTHIGINVWGALVLLLIQSYSVSERTDREDVPYQRYLQPLGRDTEKEGWHTTWHRFHQTSDNTLLVMDGQSVSRQRTRLYTSTIE